MQNARYNVRHAPVSSVSGYAARMIRPAQASARTEALWLSAQRPVFGYARETCLSNIATNVLILRLANLIELHCWWPSCSQAGVPPAREAERHTVCPPALRSTETTRASCKLNGPLGPATRGAFCLE